MVQEHGISKNRMLSFNLHEGKGWWLDRKPWGSNHWHRKLSGVYTNRLEEVLKKWENYITEIYKRPTEPENIEAKPEEDIGANKKRHVCIAK